MRVAYLVSLYSEHHASYSGRMWRNCYLNGQNAGEALQVYHRNHGLRGGPYTVKAVRDQIRKFQETVCTCDLFLLDDHSADDKRTFFLQMHAVFLAFCNCRILWSAKFCALFRPLQHVQMPQEDDKQQWLDFANEFLIWYD